MSFCFRQLKFPNAEEAAEEPEQRNNNCHCHLIKNCRIIIFLFRSAPCFSLFFLAFSAFARPFFGERVEKLLNKQRRPLQFENLQISTNAACGWIEGKAD